MYFIKRVPERTRRMMRMRNGYRSYAKRHGVKHLICVVADRIENLEHRLRQAERKIGELKGADGREATP